MVLMSVMHVIVNCHIYIVWNYLSVNQLQAKLIYM
jgi:hypothetical protein